MGASTWDREVDFVVMGSGAAGLTGALAAASRGLDVLVVEKAGVFGGTTAVSGGVIWAPNNHRMREAGLQDSSEEALTYMRRVADGRAPDALIERYVDAIPEVLRFVESAAPIELAALTTYPDYQPELPGGRLGGRSLDNGLFDTNRLGALQPLLRQNPITGRAPITIDEAVRWGVFYDPMGLPYKEVSARAKAGVVHGGAALIGKLLLGCRDAGVTLLSGCPGRELVVDAGGAVRGLVVERAGEGDASAGVERIHARRGVLLASGGFEWDTALRRAFLPLGLERLVSPPQMRGDGLRMAMALGAELGNMAEAWWTPAVSLPGETYDAAPLHRSEFSVRCLPHSIIVNARGQRFTPEAGNYNDITKPFFDHDPTRCTRRNLPAWLLVDQQYLDRYVLVTAVKGRPLPEWLVAEQTLGALAARAGIDGAGLEATVERFNRFASEGVDHDFGRGKSAFDRFYGDPRHAPNPNLGTIEVPPFYALPIHPSAMGTKGGPRTDVDARVLRVDGAPIAGLYAAGNVAASPMGAGYPGAGSTIGAAMCWGYLAALHAAG
ncbi:MAG: FAD-dependent oxidoreductase [Myxococcales bacterium]|nr:FAD-dependent oxidoreductase [Myxococcales bacterium]